MRNDRTQGSSGPRRTVEERGPVARKWAQSLILAGFALPVGLSAATPDAALANPTSRSVPAEFVRRLALPGQANDFLRPSAMFVDRTFGEVLVVDPGHNRIVILDDSGTYKFEFAGGDHFTSPLGVVVDSQGQILVLASTPGGRRILRFDFDGVFLNDVDLDTPDGPVTRIESIAIDGEDNFYVLDRENVRICVYRQSGEFANAFPLIADLEEKVRREQVFGAIDVSGGAIYVPVPTLGSVLVHAPDGALVRSIGHAGNNVGELNFPVSVAIQDELVMVLDKHRFNVVCFTLGGKFLGEFGGKGLSPGWFYHPTILELGDRDQVYVGQMFHNKIQICRVPEFITARVLDSSLQHQRPGRT